MSVNEGKCDLHVRDAVSWQAAAICGNRVHSTCAPVKITYFPKRTWEAECATLASSPNGPQNGNMTGPHTNRTGTTRGLAPQATTARHSPKEKVERRLSNIPRNCDCLVEGVKGLKLAQKNKTDGIACQSIASTALIVRRHEGVHPHKQAI